MANFTEFYVTKGANASDNNGGGPSLGAQDGPVFTSLNTSSSSDGLTLTGAAGWVGASVGDFVCFDPTGNCDYCRITNISGNDLTVTPAVTPNLTIKVANVGGAWATIDHAMSTMGSGGVANWVNAAGDMPRCNIKYSATSYAESAILDNSGTHEYHLIFSGYYSTPGDDAMNGSTFTPPHMDAGASGATNGVLEAASKNWFVFENISVESTQSSIDGVYVNSTLVSLRRIKINCHGANTNQRGINTYGSVSIEDCWIVEATDTGIYAYYGPGGVSGCRIDKTYNYGIYTSYNYGAVAHNLIADVGTSGVYYYRGNGQVCNNTIYYCGQRRAVWGSGIVVVDPTTYVQGAIYNNIIVDSNGYGIELYASQGQYLQRVHHNAFYSNDSGETDDQVPYASDNVTLTADPFTNAAGGDFTLNSTAGGGAACKAAGFDMGESIGG